MTGRVHYLGLVDPQFLRTNHCEKIVKLATALVFFDQVRELISVGNQRWDEFTDESFRYPRANRNALDSIQESVLRIFLHKHCDRGPCTEAYDPSLALGYGL